MSSTTTRGAPAGGSRRMQRTIPPVLAGRLGLPGRPQRRRARPIPTTLVLRPRLPSRRRGRDHPGAASETQTFLGSGPAARPPGLHLGRRHEATAGQTNRDQAGNQLFYYVNNFHDYLRDTPGIDFGASSGNFENADRVARARSTTAPTSLDARQLQRLRQQRQHGHAARWPRPPLMQMYLWTEQLRMRRHGTSTAPTTPTSSTTSTSTGSATASSPTRAGSARSGSGLAVGRHGRGLERLVRRGLPGRRRLPDRHRRARARSGRAPTRTPPSAPSRSTARWHRHRRPARAEAARVRAATPTATSARSSASPEVHADGEIWVETLWDLRQALIGAHGGRGGCVPRAHAGHRRHAARARPSRPSCRPATRSSRPT